MSTTLEELLSRDGMLVYKTSGTSMEPMLRQNRDLVVIEALHSRIKKYDAVLYKRGKKYVLHRVIGVEPGHYLIRGDNTYVTERVPDQAVLGILKCFRRKGKQYEVTDRCYQCYVRIWTAVFPFRYFCFRLYRFAVGIAGKIGILPLIKRVLRHE